MHFARGFTLLEVLIALAILAIGVLAMARTITLATTGADQLQSRQLAEWVAENRLAEWRAGGLAPASGSAQGQVQQGREVFRWEEEVSGTDHSGVFRVDLRVFAEGGQHVLARLTGFIMARRQ